MKSILKKINLVLCLLSIASLVYADGAIFVPTQHSDLLNSGTNTHSQIDDFIASKGQPNGLAALDGSGNIVVSGYIGSTNGTGTGTRLESVQISSGTGTLSGVASPFIAQTNGTATGTQLNSVQIVSGTSNLSGVASPYIAQTNGTSTGGSHTATYIYGSSTIQSTSTSNSYLLTFSLGTTTPGNISTSGTVTASNLVTAWRAGSTYGYGLLNFVGSGDFVVTPTYNNSIKEGTITVSLTGTSSAKPNLLQDGVLKANAPGTISFNTNFIVDSNGSVTTRDLVKQSNGTASGTHLTNVQIASGTGTLSGVASPFIAQTSGTGTLLTVGSVSVNHNGAAITGGDISGVDMCFGDNDTGFNWVADGKIQIKTNANIIATLDSSGIPSTYDIGTSSHNVNVTHYGTFSCKNQIESQAGGIKFPDGTIQTSVPVLVGYTYGSSSAITTSIGTIPYDNTIPQNTEGTEVLSATHTVTTATNFLKIKALVNVSVNADTTVIAALFHTGTSNAIASNAIRVAGQSAQQDIPLSLLYRGSPGTTTPRGYSVRVGAVTGTIRSNASAFDGLGRFGGTWFNTLDIEEYRQ